MNPLAADLRRRALAGDPTAAREIRALEELARRGDGRAVAVLHEVRNPTQVVGIDHLIELARRARNAPTQQAAIGAVEASDEWCSPSLNPAAAAYAQQQHALLAAQQQAAWAAQQQAAWATQQQAAYQAAQAQAAQQQQQPQQPQGRMPMGGGFVPWSQVLGGGPTPQQRAGFAPMNPGQGAAGPQRPMKMNRREIEAQMQNRQAQLSDARPQVWMNRKGSRPAAPQTAPMQAPAPKVAEAKAEAPTPTPTVSEPTKD